MGAVFSALSIWKDFNEQIQKYVREYANEWDKWGEKAL